jgi:hypothetical protein
MRKLVLGLAVSTLAFAGSTVYFWNALAAERARHADPETIVAMPVAAPLPASPATPAPAPAATRSAEAAPIRDSRPSEQTIAQAIIDARKQTAAAAPAFLAKLGNAQSRAEMVAEQKALMRSFTPGLQRYLGLSDEDFDRFLESLVESELVAREAAARCALDETCRFPEYDRGLFEARRRDALSQFGPDVTEKYEYFQRSGNERRVVEQYRGRLDDATRLSDSQSEKLVRALMEANERIQEDLQKTRGNVAAVGGMVYAEMNYGETQVPAQDRSEEIAGYNRRLHDAVANVLTGPQLASFEQMQKEALDQSQVWSRQRRDDAALTSN